MIVCQFEKLCWVMMGSIKVKKADALQSELQQHNRKVLKGNVGQSINQWRGMFPVLFLS